MNDPKYQEVDLKPFLCQPTAAKGKIIEMKEYCIGLKRRSDILLTLLDSITQLMDAHDGNLFTSKLPVSTQFNVYRHLAENDVENLKIVMSRISAILADVSDILTRIGQDSQDQDDDATPHLDINIDDEMVAPKHTAEIFMKQYEIMDFICDKLNKAIGKANTDTDFDHAAFFTLYYRLFSKFNKYCRTSDLTPEQLLSTIGIDLTNLHHAMKDDCFYTSLLSINARQMHALAKMCGCDIVIAHNEKGTK